VQSLNEVEMGQILFYAVHTNIFRENLIFFYGSTITHFYPMSRSGMCGTLAEHFPLFFRCEMQYLDIDETSKFTDCQLNIMIPFYLKRLSLNPF